MNEKILVVDDEKEIADTTIKRKTRIASKATGSRNSFYL